MTVTHLNEYEPSDEFGILQPQTEKSILIGTTSKKQSKQQPAYVHPRQLGARGAAYSKDHMSTFLIEQVLILFEKREAQNKRGK